MSEPGNEQRVRSCLACGELVPFDDRTCPSCGHYEALAGAVETGPETPCRRCERSMSAQLLFCPRCGAEQADRPPAAATRIDAASAGRDLGAPLLVLGLTLVGPVVLAVVVFALLG